VLKLIFRVLLFMGYTTLVIRIVSLALCPSELFFVSCLLEALVVILTIISGAYFLIVS